MKSGLYCSEFAQKHVYFIKEIKKHLSCLHSLMQTHETFVETLPVVARVHTSFLILPNSL